MEVGEATTLRVADLAAGRQARGRTHLFILLKQLCATGGCREDGITGVLACSTAASVGPGAAGQEEGERRRVRCV